MHTGSKSPTGFPLDAGITLPLRGAATWRREKTVRPAVPNHFDLLDATIRANHHGGPPEERDVHRREFAHRPSVCARRS